MNLLSFLGIALSALCLASTMAAARAEAVDVELVLAVDVSRSMDMEEFELQRAGYVSAIRDPEFVRAVQAGLLGKIAIVYFEWAAAPRTESVVQWSVIDGVESAEAFARALEARPFGGYRGTSISSALGYATGLFDQNDFQGERRVIDISGDGPNNIGPPVLTLRGAALERGIIINGLPILVRPSRSYPALDRYYAECVTGGPGSFVLPIRSSAEFATAIRRKLILEVSGAEPPAVLRIQAREPVNCLIGEIERGRVFEQYFPELNR